MKPRRATVLALAGLALLAALPYARTLTLPFISDDYVQIWLGRHYAPPDRWSALAGDALYRCRATSILITYWTERLFGVHPLVFNLSSLLLHILNTWLVFALGAWRPVGWRLAWVAAAFFAVYEGHQEAVVWYAALPELLVFFFSLAAFLCWLRWTERGSGWWLAACGVAYLLALASKEPGVAVAGLALIPVWTERVPRRRWLIPWLAMAAVALVYAALIFAAKGDHLHLRDGTFTPGPHFIAVMLNSAVRMLWFWGWTSLVALAAWKERARLPLLRVSGAWAMVAFLPYSFLTYMPRVPSRHTYFASVALAWVVAAALIALWRRSGERRTAFAAAVTLAIVLHNAGYVWTRKYNQFLERARPTEELIAFVRSVDGPVYVHCFPYPVLLAKFVGEIRLGREVIPVGNPADAHGPLFCSGGHHRTLVAGAGE